MLYLSYYIDLEHDMLCFSLLPFITIYRCIRNHWPELMYYFPSGWRYHFLRVYTGFVLKYLVSFQAGLLIDIIGHQGRGVCGASLLSRRVMSTAAHCWFDGIHQGWRMEVVLGTVMLFQGGNRQFTSVVVNHPNWFPLLVRNDVAVVYLNDEVTFSGKRK